MSMHSFRAFKAFTTWFDSKDHTQQKHSTVRSLKARETIPLFCNGGSRVLTFRPRPLNRYLEKARFSHTRDIWSFDRYEHETHHTSHVRSWTRPMRFKYHFYATEAKLSLNFKFIASSHTKRVDFFSV